MRSLVKLTPVVKSGVFEEGREVGGFIEARKALRSVLAHRKLALTSDEAARIEACTDLATLERLHEQALDASSASEALRA